MFENIVKFFKNFGKNDNETKSKDAAKERLHLVLMQDRANISADFLALMKQEIIEVIKKYIDVDENAIDVRLTNKANDDGTTGAPVLYANIPIMSVKEEAKEEARKIKVEQGVEEPKEVIQKTDKAKSETNKKAPKEEKNAEKEEQKEALSAKKEEVKQEETNEVIEKAEEIAKEIEEQDGTAKTN